MCNLWRMIARPPEAGWPCSGVGKWTNKHQDSGPQTLPRNDQGTNLHHRAFGECHFPLTQNAHPDNAKERPRNAKERFALKLCPLSGKTAFLGIALWKDRIFKRKNARPRNAIPPPKARNPGASLAHIVTHPPFFNPPDVGRTAPAYSKMHAAPILEVSRSTTDEGAIPEVFGSPLCKHFTADFDREK